MHLDGLIGQVAQRLVEEASQQRIPLWRASTCDGRARPPTSSLGQQLSSIRVQPAEIQLVGTQRTADLDLFQPLDQVLGRGLGWGSFEPLQPTDRSPRGNVQQCVEILPLCFAQLRFDGILDLLLDLVTYLGDQTFQGGDSRSDNLFPMQMLNQRIKQPAGKIMFVSQGQQPCGDFFLKGAKLTIPQVLANPFPMNATDASLPRVFEQQLWRESDLF